MRILFVISCLNYGGAEKNLMLVANYLCKKGNNIGICNFNERETVQLISDDITYFEKDTVYEKSGKFSWVGFRKQQYKYLKNCCKKFNPDVIVSFLNMPNFLSVICGFFLGIPVVISERADPYRANSILDKIIHYVYNYADGAVFQSDGAKSFYSKKLQRKSVVISNPIINVKEEFFYNVAEAEKVIAFAGRFETVQKRQDIMLEVMKLVLEKHADYKLAFYGDGKDEDDIKMLASKIGIEDNVEFKGVSDNLVKDISKCEIYVLTSDYEGIPNTLLEAMTIGMPCVSTDCSPGGARMLIDNGINGTLVPCGDVTAIADAINFYIENKDIAEKHGKEAVKIKDKFSYDGIMEKWEKYILEVINR